MEILLLGLLGSSVCSASPAASKSSSAASKSISDASKSSSASSESGSHSSQGASYNYIDLPKKMIQYLKKGKIIRQIHWLESPIKNMGFKLAQAFFQKKINLPHVEMIIKFQEVYFVLSFGCDGLQVKHSIQIEELINRREQNKITLSFQGYFDSKILQEFLIQNQVKRYDLLEWDCLNFTIEILKRFGLESQIQNLISEKKLISQ